MSEASTETVIDLTAYQSAATVLFWLGILSIGSSNIISAIALRSFTIFNIIGLLLIVIYFATSYFTRRGSKVAFLIGAGSFAISGIHGLITSMNNSGVMNSMLGEGSSTWVIGLNLLFVLWVGSLLIQRYKALPPA
jgi:hypothetical protein